MTCPLHTAGVGTCKHCTNLKRYESQLLLLGPRSFAQHKEIADKFEVTPLTYCQFNPQKQMVYHKLHLFAETIYEEGREDVDVLKELGSKTLTHKFINNLESHFFKSRVQLLPGTKCVIRACSKYNVHDCASMVTFVKNSGIKGVSIAELCAEYQNAYKDISILTKNGTFWQTQSFVWHKDNVVAKGTKKEVF